MYKHILIPTDGTDWSMMAVRQGITLATTLKARVTVLTVSPPFPTIAMVPFMVTDTPEQYRKDCDMAAARHLGVATEAAELAGGAGEAAHVGHWAATPAT